MENGPGGSKRVVSGLPQLLSAYYSCSPRTVRCLRALNTIIFFTIKYLGAFETYTHTMSDGFVGAPDFSEIQLFQQFVAFRYLLIVTASPMDIV